MSQTELMDLSPDKCGERSEREGKKICTDCMTTKTPLWRIGPHGPKSLCNACGIKFRKKKGGGAVMGLIKESSKKKEKPSPASSTTAAIATATTTTSAVCSGKKGNDANSSGVNRGKNGKLGSKMKVRLMGFGREVVFLKRPRSPMKRQRSYKKLGEVEQAALLLMAMSSDSVYA